MKTISLEDLGDPAEDLEFPVHVNDFRVTEPLPENAINNLKTMRKLGILTVEGIMALVAAAPIDPINPRASSS